MGKSCKTPNCYNEVKENARSTICAKCRSRRFRKKYRVKALFFINQCNARRRKTDWLITMDEWIIFCAETNYHRLVGTRPEDMTIDRIKHWLPYTIDNIRMMTKSENCSKARAERADKLRHYPQTLKGDPSVPF